MRLEPLPWIIQISKIRLLIRYVKHKCRKATYSFDMFL